MASSYLDSAPSSSSSEQSRSSSEESRSSSEESPSSEGPPSPQDSSSSGEEWQPKREALPRRRSRLGVSSDDRAGDLQAQVLESLSQDNSTASSNGASSPEGHDTVSAARMARRSTCLGDKPLASSSPLRLGLQHSDKVDTRQQRRKGASDSSGSQHSPQPHEASKLAQPALPLPPPPQPQREEEDDKHSKGDIKLEEDGKAFPPDHLQAAALPAVGAKPFQQHGKGKTSQQGDPEDVSIDQDCMHVAGEALPCAQQEQEERKGDRNRKRDVSQPEASDSDASDGDSHGCDADAELHHASELVAPRHEQQLPPLKRQRQQADRQSRVAHGVSARPAVAMLPDASDAQPMSHQDTSDAAAADVAPSFMNLLETKMAENRPRRHNSVTIMTSKLQKATSPRKSGTSTSSSAGAVPSAGLTRTASCHGISRIVLRM